MTEQLQQTLKELPEAPGIYQMLDEKGEIIYIGKSKCLKKRVASYFVPSPKWEKAKKMVPFVHELRYIQTDTHLDAMLLECQRIKEVQPYFNAQMKNDGKYVYIALGSDRRRNPLKVAHSRVPDSFGPFRSRNLVEEAIDQLRNLYPLGAAEPQYHVLPAVLSESEFQQNRQSLQRLFGEPGRIEALQTALERQMQEAARQQKYERASALRDLVQSLEYLVRGLRKQQEWLRREVVYRAPMPQGCKLFYIRNGLVVGSKVLKRCGQREIDAFVRKMEQQPTAPLDDKEALDYRSIVLAELSEAEEKNISILPPRGDETGECHGKL